MKDKLSQLYDVYVLKLSGLPLYAGCTMTDYCKSHMGRHELISGFLSAMYSFSKESFGDNELETMIYSETKLNLYIDEQNELMFVFIHGRNSTNHEIRENLKAARSLFLEKYGDYTNNMIVDQSIFEDYTDALRDEGIIPSQLGDTSMLQKTKPEHKKSRPGIFGWLKALFA